MQEALDKFLTILHGIWRFRWYAILVAWVLAPIGWVVVSKMPNQYESSAQIYVDADSVLRPMLRGIALDSIDISERLGMMSKAILSRPNLEKVIREVDLDVNITSRVEREALFSNLEKSISIKATRTHRTPRPQPPNLYFISAQNKNPELAYKIVQSLLDIFVESSLGDTREDSNVAQKFLDQQIKEYEAKLIAAEERLRQFKRGNIETLPEQGRNFYQRLQQSQTQLDEIRLQISEEENRRRELVRQIDGINPTQSVVGTDGRAIISPLQQRINTLQERLDELLLRYTDEHPDVLEAKSALESLRREQTENTDENSAEQSNPMYQQLKVTLGGVEANIAALKVRHDEYQKRVNTLQQQIEVLPKVEAELKALNRDYEINKQNYDELIKRRQAAQIADQAEQTGEKVKLKVIEPPRVPVNPFSPNRFLFSTAVFFLAVGAGVGLAFLLSQIKPAYYSQRMLKEQLGLPVLGSVSMLSLPSVVSRRKLQLLAFFTVGGLLFVSYIVVLSLQM